MKWLIPLILVATNSFAAVEDSSFTSDPRLCKSTKEFKEALKAFKKDRVVVLQEEAYIKLAHEVSKGCDGAAKRFVEVAKLLNKVGVSTQKTIEMSLEFARSTDAAKDSFFDIFQRVYLKEYFDFDFRESLMIAREFSLELPDGQENARNDFVNLVKMCVSEKEMGLPMSECSKVALEIARLSPYFPNGVSKDFKELYELLREGEGFGVSVKEALRISQEVLKYGPTAKSNFAEAFKFGIAKNGMDLDAKAALKLALDLASRSTTQLPPPLATEVEKLADEKLREEYYVD